MSLLLLLNPLAPRPHLLPHPNLNTSAAASEKRRATHLRRKLSRLRCSNPTERSTVTPSEQALEGKKPSILRSWDVPWDWKVTTYVMMPYLMSIVFTGVVESSGLEGAQRPYFQDMLAQIQSTDDVAIRMFMDQLLKSVAKLSILYMFVSPYQPFPDDIFSLRWERPLNPQNGWILWTGGGLIIASLTVFLLKAFILGSSVGQSQNEAESLVRLLPLIGSSNVSTAFLLGILGILAPICEETLYRGFFLTSLTKWFPLPLSVVLSSAVFALAHQSPGKFIEIFIFGITLGAIYAQTRNLLAPITMHACWNSGVILLLTYLQYQGHDIQKYIL